MKNQIIQLDTTDSTNNYAMKLIDSNKAQHGLTIVAQSQTAGKGQRGKTWVDIPGNSLLMTLITVPQRHIAHQFVFNASIAVAIADILNKLNLNWTVKIKWPNDIIINDKKAGGILIENILRGNNWSYSIIGFGLNINQQSFPEDLPFATSLTIEAKTNFDITVLRDAIINNILAVVDNYSSELYIMQRFNEFLYKKGLKQNFNSADSNWEAKILQANNDGTISVMHNDGRVAAYRHGEIVWIYT